MVKQRSGGVVVSLFLVLKRGDGKLTVVSESGKGTLYMCNHGTIYIHIYLYIYKCMCQLERWIETRETSSPSSSKIYFIVNFKCW